MKTSFLLPQGIVFAVLGLVVSGCKRSEVPQIPGKASHAVVVTTTPARMTNWDRTVSIIGNLYPKDSATIAAEVEGTVERTLVDFGDRIKAGQDLALIDTASYEALAEQSAGNLAKAEASLVNARQNFERASKLRQERIASDSDFDQAKAQLDQAEAEVRASRGAQGVAQLNLSRSRVKAPFDGAVARRIVGIGDYVKIGTPLFEVVNDAVLKFIFQVPERYGSFVTRNLPVSFGVDNYPGETFTGAVYLISPSVSTSSRAFNVGALVTNANLRLKANTFGRGSLVLQKDMPTVIVPLEAVVSFAGVTKVFVVENSVARSRPVVLGRIQEGWQEIVSGLGAREAVVVTGQNRLSDGAEVTLQTPVPDKSHKSIAPADTKSHAKP